MGALPLSFQVSALKASVQRERQEAEQRAREMAELHKAELAGAEAKWAAAMSDKAAAVEALSRRMRQFEEIATAEQLSIAAAHASEIKAREEEWARGHQDAVHDAAVAREALAAMERELEGKMRGGEAAWCMERARMVAEHEEALRVVEAARREQVIELEAKIEAGRREAAEKLR